MSAGRRALWFGKKLPALLLSLFLLVTAVFYLSRLAPGDPLLSYYGERAERMTPEQRARAEERLGLNGPITAQYIRWWENALRGDFGISYQYKMDAAAVIADRAGNTLALGGTGFALIFTLAPLLGALCARREGGLLDRALCRLGTLASCVPEFWLSLAAVLVFSAGLGWLPSSGAYSVDGGGLGDRIAHLILPLGVIVASHLWYFAYMVRGRILEEVRADYVLLAKAKGLSGRRVLFRHCLRGALPSYLSLMAVSVPHILGGTYIVEAVFSYPGLGTLAYESARYQDYNLLMLLCVLSGGAVMLSGMAAQAIGQWLDPRVRAGEGPL